MLSARASEASRLQRENRVAPMFPKKCVYFFEIQNIVVTIFENSKYIRYRYI